MKQTILLLTLISVFFSCQNKNVKNQSDALHGDLIVFHAGSLSVPFRLMAKEFERINPRVHVLLEPAGSVACARKIIDLKRDCDIMVSADYQVIDRYLIPEYADWNIIFASNEMVIAFTDKSKLGSQISSQNWYEVLGNSQIIFGRSDPDSDPCGYRTVMLAKLESLRKNNPHILEVLEKDQNFIRPKEVDLLGLLETNALDYIFIYKSVALQHHLKYINLSDSINLSNPELSNWYTKVEVNVAGKKPGKKLKFKGNTMAYGITRIKNAANSEVADAFIEYFFNAQGGIRLIEEQGQKIIIPSPTLSYDHLPVYLKKYAVKKEK